MARNLNKRHHQKVRLFNHNPLEIIHGDQFIGVMKKNEIETFEIACSQARRKTGYVFDRDLEDYNKSFSYVQEMKNGEMKRMTFYLAELKNPTNNLYSAESPDHFEYEELSLGSLTQHVGAWKNKDEALVAYDAFFKNINTNSFHDMLNECEDIIKNSKS